ncbi:MAG: leucine-rich repeat domain-containing protein [Ruminococcaceae bacterium]|nr:leucine-rich repeat domain-containing protein [Oscillospiraceae bacterium]
MKKRIVPLAVISVFLIIAMMFSVIAYADDVTWRYDSNSKTLYISGSGAMENYENAYSAPWNQYVNEIENLVVEDGVTSVGNYALSGADKLSYVNLADSVTSVGEYSFASCESLNELSLSKYVTSIADYSFAYSGVTLKDFTLKAPAGSYAIHYIIKNNRNSDNKIKFETEEITCGQYNVSITQTGGMMAYYPYTPKYDGTFTFYSTGTHDTRGYIYDSSYKQIAYNDDVGSNTNFRINSVTLEKGKTYYFGARIMNSSLKGAFTVYIAPVEYTISGTIYAMNDPSGAASSIVITEAAMDGVQTDGSYTRTVTEENNSAVITAGQMTFNYEFSPDAEGDIVLNMCDVNKDGYVNGRDLAYMKSDNSKYKSLFANFI